MKWKFVYLMFQGRYKKSLPSISVVKAQRYKLQYIHVAYTGAQFYAIQRKVCYYLFLSRIMKNSSIIYRNIFPIFFLKIYIFRILSIRKEFHHFFEHYKQNLVLSFFKIKYIFSSETIYRFSLKYIQVIHKYKTILQIF